MTSVLVAVPTFETISPETFKSIYGLVRPEGVAVQFDFVRGYDCARARNLIAQEAINFGFDYVLMVDSDIVLPADALVRMLADPVEVCLGCYPRKCTTNGVFELFKLDQKDYVKTFSFDELKELSGKVEVKGGGFGCALIRVDVFRVLPRPWFRYVEYTTGDVLSEDNYFCGLATAAGLKVYADTDVMCGHAIRGFQWR